MDRETAKALVDALAAASGIVAVVGAGGKKSTLYRLLEAHRTLGTRRVLLTSTVQIAATRATPDVETLIVDGDARATIAAMQGRAGAFLVAGPPTGPGRFSGLPEDLIPHLHEKGAFEVSLVKSDGARMRMIKAPRDGEPALPDGVSTVIPIVAARVFDRPLTEKLAHRPERLLEIIGADIGTAITPDHVARLLANPEGALRRSGNAWVAPVINMVDGPERLALAREAAKKALAMTDRFDRVVLASMTSPTPLIEVVTG
ncbi:MAG: selenium cofactor biosynthesis protein YqeC [Pseudomonadota bacterium]